MNAAAPTRRSSWRAAAIYRFIRRRAAGADYHGHDARHEKRHAQRIAIFPA